MRPRWISSRVRLKAPKLVGRICAVADLGFFDGLERIFVGEGMDGGVDFVEHDQPEEPLESIRRSYEYLSH